MDGILIGHVVDVLLDSRGARVLGLEVRCGDGEHRFLPLAAARLCEEEVVARSPLAFLDAPELGFYARRGRSLRALRRSEKGRQVDDVELDERGTIHRLRVAGKRDWLPAGRQQRP